MDPASFDYQFGTLLDASIVLGADMALVQGAGGNFSLKFDNELWIKASGTRLSQARETQIYLPLDIAQLSALALVTEDVAESRVYHVPTSHLRPSIETALHVLIPHRFVFHVHSVSAIAAGLTDDGIAAFMSVPGAFQKVDVPYAKPGINLARAVSSALNGQFDASTPLVLLLRNHGIVVGADSAEEASALVELVESTLRRKDPAPLSERPANDASSYYSLYPAKTLSRESARALAGGALTPDSAVFLGDHPFALSSEHAERSPGRVESDGSVSVIETIGSDELEILMSLVEVGRQVTTESIRRLSPENVSELVDWEAEKWRQGMKR